MPSAVLPDNTTDRLQVDAIGVDLDGTLVDSAPDLADAANVTLDSLGIEALPISTIRRMIGDGIATLVRRCLTEGLGRPATDSECKAAMPLFLQSYRDNLFCHSRVYQGVIPALKSWREAGKHIACITNKHSDLTLALLQEAGLRTWFDGVYCADLTAERKPAPSLIQRFLGDCEVAPARFVMFGDSSHDVVATRAVGGVAVAVSYGYGNPEELASAAPDFTVERLDTLKIA